MATAGAPGQRHFHSIDLGMAASKSAVRSGGNRGGREQHQGGGAPGWPTGRTVEHEAENSSPMLPFGAPVSQGFMPVLPRGIMEPRPGGAPGPHPPFPPFPYGQQPHHNLPGFNGLLPPPGFNGLLPPPGFNGHLPPHGTPYIPLVPPQSSLSPQAQRGSLPHMGEHPGPNGLLPAHPMSPMMMRPLGMPILPHFDGGESSAGSLPGTARKTSSCRKPAARLPDDADNIKVALRVRPMSDAERSKGAQAAVRVTSQAEVQVISVGPRGASTEKSFRFHACLGPEAQQADVMALCNVPVLLDAALSGYSVSILAYGQTGSGKTFTMSGREENEQRSLDDPGTGIMSRSCSYLFSSARQASTKTKFRCTFLEIYNEQIYDLINWTKQPLPVRWETAKGFHVPGLRFAECLTLEDVIKVVATGLNNRSVGSHELNMESSRSHSIFTIYTEQPSACTHGGDVTHCGKVSFVDLAGSERLKDSQSSGDMKKETSNINRSLFALGKVISALATARSSPGVHVPYRDSMLTKLLMDSLGGGSLALLIACCSPTSASVEETLSTLQYASRAKNIVNKPIQNVEQEGGTVQMLRREIELLKAENQLLKESSQPSTPQNHRRNSLMEFGGLDASPSPSFRSRPQSPLPPLQRSPSRDAARRSPGRGDADRLAAQLEATQAQLRNTEAQNEQLRREVEELRQAQGSDGAKGVVAEIQHISSRLVQLEANMAGSSDSLTPPAGPPAEPPKVLEAQAGSPRSVAGNHRQSSSAGGASQEVTRQSPLSACGRPPSRQHRRADMAKVPPSSDLGADNLEPSALGGSGGQQLYHLARTSTNVLDIGASEVANRLEDDGSPREPEDDHSAGANGKGVIVANPSLMQALLFGD